MIAHWAGRPLRRALCRTMALRPAGGNSPVELFPSAVCLGTLVNSALWLFAIARSSEGLPAQAPTTQSATLESREVKPRSHVTKGMPVPAT